MTIGQAELPDSIHFKNGPSASSGLAVFCFTRGTASLDKTTSINSLRWSAVTITGSFCVNFLHISSARSVPSGSSVSPTRAIKCFDGGAFGNVDWRQVDMKLESSSLIVAGAMSSTSFWAASNFSFLAGSPSFSSWERFETSLGKGDIAINSHVFKWCKKLSNASTSPGLPFSRYLLITLSTIASIACGSSYSNLASFFLPRMVCAIRAAFRGSSGLQPPKTKAGKALSVLLFSLYALLTYCLTKVRCM